MTAESYSLAEVAELLGVSKRTLQRQIRDGAFPGRFLAPSPHGMEMRIPAGDLSRAGNTDESTPSQPPRDSEWSEGQLATLSNGPVSSTSLSPIGLEDFRESLLSIIREERSAFLAEVRSALARRDDEERGELAAVRGAVEELREEVGRMRDVLSEGPAVSVTQEPRWAEALGGSSSELDVDGLLSELGELEAMLGVPES